MTVFVFVFLIGWLVVEKKGAVFFGFEVGVLSEGEHEGGGFNVVEKSFWELELGAVIDVTVGVVSATGGFEDDEPVDGFVVGVSAGEFFGGVSVESEKG